MPHVRTERCDGGYTIVWLQREPVNTMDLPFWRELSAALAAAEANPAVRGLIFASALKRSVFTAGNDIKELYAPRTSFDRYRKFWVESNQFLARLYRSPLVTLCAIRGACPAGGCCLSLCCDLRLMADGPGHIGLNEVAIGISVPLYWARLMARVIGQSAAERLCQFASLVGPQEAKELGLVDRLVPEAELLPAAESAMRSALALPDSGRALVKERLRGEFSREWEAYPAEEAVGAWQQLEDPATVKMLGAVLARLSGSSKRAKL
ncbi:hypothetical protein WJX81_007504 [Elliptochloris bilobata]|uniref:Uncharacterized protein n=1 Tax=Elliptochloris bilobata TaxID=381761 RepID=A0AAW1SC70_9CHLO